VRKLVGRIALSTNVNSDRLILDNRRDVENFVPGLPLYFAANENWPFRSHCTPPLVARVDREIGIIYGAGNWTHDVIAIASGDFIFVITPENCPHCGAVRG
jgi:hypothetical protein